MSRAEDCDEKRVMLGSGKRAELFQTMDDLREIGCQVLTMASTKPGRVPAFCRCGIRFAGTLRGLRRNRARERVRARCFRAAVRSSYHAADFHPVVR